MKYNTCSKEANHLSDEEECVNNKNKTNSNSIGHGFIYRYISPRTEH